MRLVVIRFNDLITQLPFQPTPEWAHRMAADFRQMSDYFRTRNVRVVNMSWEYDPEEFEAWLSNTGAGADPVERKRRAAEVFAIWHDAVESAIRSAPNTLFVCAAGNNNRDAGFAQDVPASLRLPNLISVGAVTKSGKETDFTSYGDTVVMYANGYQVESYVPGGSRMKKSRNIHGFAQRRQSCREADRARSVPDARASDRVNQEGRNRVRGWPFALN